MLDIDLNQLMRVKTIVKEIIVEPDEFDVSSFNFCLNSPVSVNLKASHTSSEELMLTGSLETLVEQNCSRCLKPVETKMVTEVDLHFTSKEAIEMSDEIEEELQFEWSQGALDVKSHLFQEIILNAPAFVQCGDSCQGICPGCGLNLNKTKCECPEQPRDPRWDVLLPNLNK